MATNNQGLTSLLGGLFEDIKNKGTDLYNKAWLSPAGAALAKAQEVVQSPNKINVPAPQPVKKFAGGIPYAIANEIIRTPINIGTDIGRTVSTLAGYDDFNPSNQAKSGLTKVGSNVANAYKGTPVTPQKYFGDLGEAGIELMNMFPTAIAGKFAGKGVAATAKPIVKIASKTLPSVAEAGLYGILSGLEKNKDLPFSQQLKQAGVEGLVNAPTGLLGPAVEKTAGILRPVAKKAIKTIQVHPDDVAVLDQAVNVLNDKKLFNRNINAGVDVQRLKQTAINRIKELSDVYLTDAEKDNIIGRIAKRTQYRNNDETLFKEFARALQRKSKSVDASDYVDYGLGFVGKQESKGRVPKVNIKSVEEPVVESAQKVANVVEKNAPTLEVPANTLTPASPAPVGRGGIQAPNINFTQWKDKNKLSLNRETLERNLEDIAGTDAQKVKDFIVNPIRYNETKRTEYVNGLRREVKDVIKNLNIKPGSKDDALVQQYGEKIMSLQDLQAASPGNWQNIAKAAEFFRGKYDNLLNNVNAVRENFGYNPIPKRDDYFRHFQEINNVIKQFGLLLREQDIPTEIAGITSIFKPGKPFSTSELARIGNLTDYSAVKGFENYIDSISKQIFHIDSVQRARNLEKYIRQSAAGNDQIKLPNLVANLSEYGNLLAGKKSTFDRAFEDLFGRPVYAIANYVKGKVGANMTGLNLSSALTNFIPLTQSFATTSKPQALHGLLDGMSGVISKSPTEIGGIKSSFLTRRFPEERIPTSILDNATDAANALFKGIDQFVSRSVVAGKYYEGLSKGLSSEEAMKLADNYAGRVITDRSLGQLPNLFGSKTIGFVTQFQTEVNNLYSFLKKDIPRMNDGNALKIANALTQMAVFSYLYNSLYENIAGRRPTIDPIQYGLQLAGLTQDSEDNSLPENVGKVAGELAGNLPFTGGITGGRLPVGAALPDVTKVYEGASSYLSGDKGGAGQVSAELAKPLFYLAPPFGGGQLKKSIEGLSAIVRNGVYDPQGNLKFPVGDDLSNQIRTIVFGRYSTPEARLFFDKQMDTLSNKETAIWKDAVAKGADPVTAWAGMYKFKLQSGAASKMKNIITDRSLTPEAKKQKLQELKSSYGNLVSRLNGLSGLEDGSEVLASGGTNNNMPGAPVRIINGKSSISPPFSSIGARGVKIRGRKPRLSNPKLTIRKGSSNNRSVKLVGNNNSAIFKAPKIEDLLANADKELELK